MKRSKQFLAVLVTTVAATGLASMGVAQAANSGFTPSQVKNIQQIIQNYIVNNPEVLVEASRSLQAKEMQKIKTAALKVVRSNVKPIFNDPATPVLGNVNGNITLVEFYDYQCGHCRRMLPVTSALLKKDKNLKLVLKDLPIIGGPSSVYAAEASMAAFKQGTEKFTKFRQLLMTSPTRLSKQVVLADAKKAGLDVTKLEKSINSPANKQQLKSNFQLAQLLRIQGTPFFIIGNTAKQKFSVIPGGTTAQNMQAAINSVE